MQMCRSASLILSASIVLMAAGCGSSGPALYEAGGTVTVDGSPLEGATVTFVPQGDKMLGGAGRTDAAGKFTLLASSGKPGISAGDYKVTVRKVEGEGFDGGPNATKEEQEKAMMDMMTGKTGPPKSLIPLSYADATKTPLSATVTDDPEENNFTLDVKSSVR